MKTLIWILIFEIFVEFVVAQNLTDPDLETSISEDTYYKLLSLPGQNECGNSSVKAGRIVGGEPAKLGAWPWIAAIGWKQYSRTSFFCGATLISDRYAITAAHCFGHFQDTQGLFLRLGDLNLLDSVDDGATPVNVDLESFLIHPRYEEAWAGFDIALLTLKSKVTFTDLIQPICLPVKDEFFSLSFDGYQPFVAGWGLTSEHGVEVSPQLMQVQLPLINRDECTELISVVAGVQLHPDCICAYADGKDSCQGDSGGPVMFPLEEKYYLFGVTSWGVGCARPNSPGIYNKVHTHIKWIASNAK